MPAKTYNGWFIGSGYEYAFDWLPIPGLFWKTEYRYSQYNSATPSFVTTAGVPTSFSLNTTKFTQFCVDRTGLALQLVRRPLLIDAEPLRQKPGTFVPGFFVCVRNAAASRFRKTNSFSTPWRGNSTFRGIGSIPFAKVFQENLRYLKSFSPSPTPAEGAATSGDVPQGTTPPEKVPTPAVSREARVREFLDTCFVMMPFGEWFDRYYQEIYVPAIKEAGFEPVRADELFTTGSVVEQIWEQIQKAKLLLADLSGKNANVFYELGPAHTDREASRLYVFEYRADFLFDLRHLRVIIYDIREPEWATRLRKSIADYLRNAMKDPEKSIPHPFRRLIEEEKEEILPQKARDRR